MATRLLLGVVAGGIALAGLSLHPLVALAGILAALLSLLASCARAEAEEPSPSRGSVWACGLTLAAVLLGALFLRGRSPVGFLWLLGPGFVLAVPLFLAFFARSFRKP